MFNRSRSLLSKVGSLLGLGAKLAIVDDINTPKAPVTALPRRQVQTITKPVRTRTARLSYYASYKGGKGRRGVPKAIQAIYISEAQAKRERKNAKRRAEFHQQQALGLFA